MNIGPPSVEALSRLLTKGDYNARKLTAERLWRLRDKRAVGLLVTTLKQDKSWHVRAAAAKSLGIRRDKAAVEPLIAALKDKHNDVGVNAARALASLGDERAIRPIIEMMRTAMMMNPMTAASMEQTLASFGPVAVEPLTEALKDKDARIRRLAAGALAKLDVKQPLEPLIAALTDKSSGVRYRAAGGLGKTGDKRAVEPLIAALADGSDDVRAEASRALGNLGDKRAVKALVAILLNKGGRTRSAAARALKKLDWKPTNPDERVAMLIASSKWYDLIKLGDKRAVEPLIGLLGDRSFQERQGITRALGGLGDKRAVKPVIAMLKDKNWGTRCRAAEALGKLGDKRAVEPLIAAIKDEDEQVRTAAAMSLGQLGGKDAIRPLITALNDKDARARKAAGEALKGLKPKFDNDEDRAKFLAVTGQCDKAVKLGKVSFKPLLAALESPDDKTRASAAAALGKLGDKRAVMPLLKLLGDREAKVSNASVKSLGKLRDKRAIPPLMELLKDKDWFMRCAAANALGKLGDKRAVGPLADALKDTDPRVRLAAVEALGGLKDKKAVTALITALSIENDRVQNRAWKALIDLGPLSVEPLAVKLVDKDAPVTLRLQAVDILRRLKWRPVTERQKVCNSVFGDPFLGRRQPGPESIEPLVAMLKAPRNRSRRTAAGCLQRLEWKPGTEAERACFFVALGRWTEAVRLGAPALKPLGVAVKDSDKFTRVAAAGTLSKMGPGAVKPLIAAMKNRRQFYDPKPPAKALAKIGAPAVKPLVELMKTHTHLARIAADTLVKIGPPAVMPLVEALKDENDYVREYAAEALCKLNDKRSIPGLVATLADDHAGSTAAEALNKLSWKPSNNAERVHYLFARRQNDKLLERWSVTRKVLMADIHSDHRPAVKNAVYALGTLKPNDRQITDELIRLLTDSGSVVLAEDFIESGRPRLRRAARAWLKRRQKEPGRMPSMRFPEMNRSIPDDFRR